MSLFTHTEFDGHLQVVHCHDCDTGLKAIIALHNLNRGPALGGCRMWPYANEAEALTDVLRLSRGMTYKSALAELEFGGGKSVIIGDPKQHKSKALFRAMGRFVESLGGRYIIAEDVGISVADIEAIGQTTNFIAGVPAGGSGDPSPATAYGVFMGLKAAVKHRLRHDSLKGLRVAVQGLGHVGHHLCRQLAAEGAELIVADLDDKTVAQTVQQLGAKAVESALIYDVDCDVYAPCALGATVNPETLARLKAKIIAGSANNQLDHPETGSLLSKMQILYAPDYVINAGGVINISHEGRHYDKARAYAHVARIHDTLLEIFRLAEHKSLPTSVAADRVAEARFTKGSPISIHAA